MNILLVTQYFYPEQFRINDIAKALARKENHVVVITGRPNYPVGEIFEGYENDEKRKEQIDGVTIIRCKCRPRHTGTVNLALNYVSFAVEATKEIRKLEERFDCVLVYGISPVTQALPAIWLKKKQSVPVVYYCLDMWPESVRGEQNGHKQIGIYNPIYLIARIITKYIYKNCDYILNKCDDFIEYNNKICKVNINKQCLLFEHAEESYLNISSSPIDNGIIDFMFLGNIGKVQNCDHIVKAFAKLKGIDNVRLHFVGDGSEYSNIQELVEQLRLSEKIFFHGRHSVQEINSYYELADVCVLALSNRTGTGVTLPAKLTSYMAAARPIVASINGSAKRIIEDAQCGFSTQADDIDGLASIMQKFIDNPKSIHEMGENGRRYFIEHFTLDIFIENLEKILKNVVTTKEIKNE